MVDSSANLVETDPIEPENIGWLCEYIHPNESSCDLTSDMYDIRLKKVKRAKYILEKHFNNKRISCRLLPRGEGLDLWNAFFKYLDIVLYEKGKHGLELYFLKQYMF
jgi:hypothetical protein